MDIMYKLCGSIKIKPIWWNDAPKILVKLDDEILYNDEILETTSIPFNKHILNGKHFLFVNFLNKGYNDTILEENKDKAVIVESVEFFGIIDPRFIWNKSYYKPEYPEDYHNKIDQLNGHNYLSWNGIWCLEFTSPIFTWIHDVTNLGWIYE